MLTGCGLSSPQIKGLGLSSTAQRFAISSLEEGAAYLEDPVLERRLEECTVIVNGLDRSVQNVFGYPDDLKFHSSMTLFAKVVEECGFDKPVFKEALAKHFANRPDEGTLRQLRV